MQDAAGVKAIQPWERGQKLSQNALELKQCIPEIHRTARSITCGLTFSTPFPAGKSTGLEAQLQIEAMPLSMFPEARGWGGIL